MTTWSPCGEWGTNLKSRPSTFRAKLWRYFALFAVAILAMLWLLQTVFLQAFYDQAVKTGARDAAARIEQSWTRNDPDAFAQELDSIASERSLLVFVATWDSEVLYSTDEHSAEYTAKSSPSAGDSANSHDWAQDQQGYSSDDEDGNGVRGWQLGQVRQAGLTEGFGTFLERLSQNPGAGIEYQDDDGSLYTYGIALPPEGAEGSACAAAEASAVLYLSTTLQPVGAAASAIRLMLILATVVALALAFALAAAMARGFSKPIEQLTAKASRLASPTGDATSGVFEGGFCAELDDLSGAIDGAASDLALAEERRAEFMANVSHDLRTPLTLIRGYAEAVSDDLAEGRPIEKDDLDVIAHEAERLGSLASELLDYSKLKAGAVEPNLAEFDASAAFGASAALFAPICERAGIRLDMQIEPNMHVVADEQQLTRVVANFVDNAVSHTHAGGSVCVVLRKTTSSAHFEVRDSGPGVEPDELGRVWDRYFTRSQTKRNAKGSGLGLAISREILEAHGAHYGVESELGHGATFWFEIPF